MSLRSKDDPDFETRWAAWLARGAAHDRAIRRRLTILVPVAAGVAVVVVVVYALAIR